MKHYYFNVVVKLTPIGTCCKPPLKEKKKIRILFLLFGKKQTDHSCFSYTTSKTSKQLFHLLPFVLSRIRDSATLLIRISACQWIRDSECYSRVQFPYNGFRSYFLALIKLPSLGFLCILSQLAFTSVVLNFAVQYKRKQAIDTENMSLI